MTGRDTTRIATTKGETMTEARAVRISDSVRAESDVVVMTPEWAKDLLQQSTFRNRHIKKNVLRRYTDDMRAGKWHLTHQGLLIDIDTNEVVDGQHRLHACIQSDTPFQTVITFMEGASRMFPHVDAGNKRSAADTLEVEGVSNSVITAAALRVMLAWESGLTGSSSAAAYSNEDIQAAYHRNQSVYARCVTLGASVSASLSGNYNMSSGFSAALMVLSNTAPPADVYEWAQLLASGAFQPGAPELALQRWVMRTVPSYPRGLQKNLVIVEGMVRTWNAHRSGRSLSQISVRPGSRPTVRP